MDMNNGASLADYQDFESSLDAPKVMIIAATTNLRTLMRRKSDLKKFMATCKTATIDSAVLAPYKSLGLFYDEDLSAAGTLDLCVDKSDLALGHLTYAPCIRLARWMLRHDLVHVEHEMLQ